MRKRVLLVTGKPGIGKTTVVTEVVDALKTGGYSVGGMISREVRSDSVRTGFKITDLRSGREGWLARVAKGEGPRIGRYCVEMQDLVSIGVSAIADALNGSDVVVIDEIGPMELFSRDFREVVAKAADQAKVLLCAVHKKAQNNLLGSLKTREDAQLFEVTADNRNALSKAILDRALLILSSKG